MGTIVGAVAGIGSGIMGFMGASDASEQAGQYSQLQGEAAMKMAKIAEDQWATYKQVYLPFEKGLLKEVKTPVRQQSGFLAAMGGINRGYADSAGNIRRMLSEKSPYGAGAKHEFQESNERNRIRDLYKSESDWNTQMWNRKAQLATLGKGLPAQALAGYGSAAGTYGSMANMYSNLASQGYGAAGQAFGNVLNMIPSTWSLGGSGGSGGGTVYPVSGGFQNPYVFDPSAFSL